MDVQAVPRYHVAKSVAISKDIYCRYVVNLEELRQGESMNVKWLAVLVKSLASTDAVG